MHKESIDKKTKSVLEKIKRASFMQDFYLAGGTALAIEIGHRISVDLDFFSRDNFDTKKIIRGLSALGRLSVNEEYEGTVNAVLGGIKISFLHYPYKQLYEFLKFDSIKLADKRDIAAMKIDAVSSRGSKKDFVDIYFLLKIYSLNELIGFFEKKYASVKYNKTHIIKSLTFFEDAENEPLPKMIKDFSWGKAKEKIIKETKTII